MQKRATALTAILILALVAVVSAGATLAYLTDKDSTGTIRYSIGHLTIKLEEPIWSQGNELQPGSFTETGTTPVAKFSPERQIIKDPEVYVEEGSVPCYIRIHAKIDPELEKVIQWPPEANDKWIRRDGENKYEYYYYYPEVVTQKNRTPPAFYYINFLNPRAAGMTAEEFFSPASGKSIDVKAQAVQAEGFATWQEAPWNDEDNVWVSAE